PGAHALRSSPDCRFHEVDNDRARDRVWVLVGRAPGESRHVPVVDVSICSVLVQDVDLRPVGTPTESEGLDRSAQFTYRRQVTLGQSLNLSQTFTSPGLPLWVPTHSEDLAALFVWGHVGAGPLSPDPAADLITQGLERRAERVAEGANRPVHSLLRLGIAKGLADRRERLIELVHRLSQRLVHRLALLLGGGGGFPALFPVV